MQDSTTTSSDSTPPYGIIAVVVAVVLVGAIIGAMVLSGSDDSTASETQIEGSTADSAQTGTVSIAGDSLPTFEALSTDTAVGTAAPVASATDFGGRPYKVGGDGTGRVVSFFAHWCPHCQRELPIFVEWMSKNDIPDNVEIVAVSTSVDPGKPNYPPYSWFVREGYDTTKGRLVRDDATNSFAVAYGLTGYPYTVVVDPDGNVVQRISGEVPEEQVGELVALAAG